MMIRVLPFSLCFLTLLTQGNGDLLTSRTSATPTTKGRSGSQIHAVVPTTKGQIGINPVETDLGDASTYLGSVYGTDTKYITVDATTTKVSPNSDFHFLFSSLTLN